MHGLGAWDSAAPSSIIADACCACTKAEKKNRQKIKMAVKPWERRNRGGLTSQEERIGIIVFFREQTSISATAAAGFGALMRHAESGWTGPWSTMMLAERVASCVDSAADLWGLPATMKSGLRGGGGRVFVRTYLSVIYHTTILPRPFDAHWPVSCILNTVQMKWTL